MDDILPIDVDYAIDLEKGEVIGKEERSPDPVLGAQQMKTCFTKVGSGLVSVDALTKDENGLNSSYIVEPYDVDSPECVKLSIGNKVGREEPASHTEKKTKKEKRKLTSAKKPPRPPRGLSLDASDQKLIREIAELAMMKRARIERMKALKKARAAKASSLSGNLFAVLFTVVVCLVIIFQGISSGGSSALSFLGSPQSAATAEGGFILVQGQGNPSSGDTSIPNSGSFNLVSGSNPGGKVSRAAG